MIEESSTIMATTGTPEPDDNKQPISAAKVKELRDLTSAPMMDCKKALTEANGDVEKAIVLLRKSGAAMAKKKATRVTSEGSVAHYIHAGGKIGVLVEVNCESDFVARTDDFKELVHDIAMHIAASDPKFVRYEEVCLLEQPFIKDQTMSIAQLIAAKIGKLGENISVRRFARFKVGDAGETVASTKPTEQKTE